MCHRRSWSSLAAALLGTLSLAACGRSGPAHDSGVDGARENSAPDSAAADTPMPRQDAAVRADAPGEFEGGVVDAGGGDALEASNDADGASDYVGDVNEVPDGAGPEAPTAASGTPYRTLAVSTGRQHTCALLDNHRVKCWGMNPYGELGLGDNRDRGALATDMGDALPFVELGTGRTAVAISAGSYHTCAILDDGSVKCWGIESMTGVPANSLVGNLGDAPGEMGDNLPRLDLGGHKATLLASGYADSCAVLDDGSVSCWGEDTPSLVPTPVPVGSTAKIVQLTPASFGVMALFGDGTVSGRLPDGASLWNPGGRLTSIAGSHIDQCGVLENGTATCLMKGNNDPPAMTPGLVALDLVGDFFSTCGLFVGGSVRCWGDFPSCVAHEVWTTYWCDVASAGTDQGFTALLGQPAVALPTAGGYDMCALLADGGIKCWSLFPSYCQFDNGTFVGCTVPPKEQQDPNLGASVDVVTTANGRQYGAWHEIDLGTHP
jgi:hypothetical protein